MAIYRVQSKKLTPGRKSNHRHTRKIYDMIMNYTSWDLLVQKKKKKLDWFGLQIWGTQDCKKLSPSG